MFSYATFGCKVVYFVYACSYVCFHSSQPVNMFPPTALGFYDVYGNVWDWVEDHFNGLPGFEVTYLYNDFSTPCFDGRHTMIMVRHWHSHRQGCMATSIFNFLEDNI